MCRVCVAYDFYAFYAFSALLKSVSYGNTDGLKVQVPPPASRKYFIINRFKATLACVCARSTFRMMPLRDRSAVVTVLNHHSSLSSPKDMSFLRRKICQKILAVWLPGDADTGSGDFRYLCISVSSIRSSSRSRDETNAVACADGQRLVFAVGVERHVGKLGKLGGTGI